MKKYLLILKNTVQIKMAYRIDTLAFLFSELLSLGIMSYVWLSVYHGGGSMGGYSLGGLIIYYVFSKFIILTINSYNIGWTVGDEIRLGGLTMYLTKPISQMFRHLSIYGGNVILRVIMFAPIFLLIAYIYGGRSVSLFNIFIFFIYLIVGFFINFFVFYFIGIMTFYLGFVQGINFVAYNIFFFLAGNIIPLDLLSGVARSVVYYLPFRYMSFVPVYSLTNGFDLAVFLVGVFWMIFLYLLCFVLYNIGIRKYEAYGS